MEWNIDKGIINLKTMIMKKIKKNYVFYLNLDNGKVEIVDKKNAISGEIPMPNVHENKILNTLKSIDSNLFVYRYGNKKSETLEQKIKFIPERNILFCNAGLKNVHTYKGNERNIEFSLYFHKTKLKIHIEVKHLKKYSDGIANGYYKEMLNLSQTDGIKIFVLLGDGMIPQFVEELKNESKKYKGIVVSSYEEFKHNMEIAFHIL